MAPRFALAVPAALAAALFASSANAELRDENLLITMPEGYVVANRAHNSKSLITEMIPDGQSIDDWSEMVTVQIFRDLANDTPTDFRSHMATQWRVTCAGGAMTDATDTSVNGYPSASWTLTCPLSPQGGKPEVALFKAIQGNDALYVVQKAFKWVPEPDETAPWNAYLAKVIVCDTRLEDRPCPTGK